MITSQVVSTTDVRFNEADFSALYDVSQDSITVYGVVDQTEKWIIPAKYRFIEIGDGNTFLFLSGLGLYGYLDGKGSVQIQPTFEYATAFHGNVAITSEGGLQSEGARRDYLFSQRYRLYTGGTWSIIGKDGKIVSTSTYDYIRTFSDGRAAFNKGCKWRRRDYSEEYILTGGTWGFIDENGTEIIPATYSYVYDFNSGKAKVRKEKEFKWISKQGTETTAAEAKENVVRIHCLRSRFGYIDEKGNWKIQPMFFDAGAFSEGLAAVQALQAGDNRCNSQTVSNYELNNWDYDFNPLNDFEEVMIAASEAVSSEYDPTSYVKRYWGYCDPTGKIVIPEKFDYALPFSNGRAYVCYRDKWGVIDRTGKWIFAPVMTLPWQMQGADSRMRGVDTHGELPWFWDSVERMEAKSDLFSFNENVGIVYYKEKFGYIDTNGKVIVAPVYDQAKVFQHGRGAVAHSSMWGYINKNGKEVIALKYQSAGSFSPNGLASISVSKNNTQDGDQEAAIVEYSYSQNLSGYIDSTGAVVIEPRFHYSEYFCDGLAKVIDQNNMVGYIDRNGKYVIQPKYRTGSNFSNGFAMVSSNYEAAHFINKTGGDATQYSLKKLPPYDEALMPIINDEELYGYRKQNGQWSIQPQFAMAYPFHAVY